MRPLRKCMICPEREAFVDLSRKKGCTEITARCKNRYIDEFVRFCLATDSRYVARKSELCHVIEFATHLYETAFLRNTASAKLSVVLSWLRWLHANGKIKTSDFVGLRADDLLDQIHTKRKKRNMNRALNSKVAKSGPPMSQIEAEFDEYDD